MGIWERFGEKIREEGETETHTYSLMFPRVLSLSATSLRELEEKGKGT